MTFVSIGLYIALAEILLFNGHSWDSSAFWEVMGIAAVLSIINFAQGLHRG